MKCDLAGDLTIATVARVKAQLLSAIVPGGALDVDTCKVAEVDNAGMQLLVAALTTAAGKGMAVLFPVEKQGAAVQDALRCFGLADQDWTAWTEKIAKV